MCDLFIAVSGDVIKTDGTVCERGEQVYTADTVAQLGGAAVGTGKVDECCPQLIPNALSSLLCWLLQQRILYQFCAAPSAVAQNSSGAAVAQNSLFALISACMTNSATVLSLLLMCALVVRVLVQAANLEWSIILKGEAFCAKYETMFTVRTFCRCSHF